MSRRHSAEKREINPDPKFGDIVVSKFMNSIMQDGKKSVAEAIVYGAFDSIETRTRQSPVTLATFPSWGSWPGWRHARGRIHCTGMIS